jgi:hypothetical protein
VFIYCVIRAVFSKQIDKEQLDVIQSLLYQILYIFLRLPPYTRLWATCVRASVTQDQGSGSKIRNGRISCGTRPQSTWEGRLIKLQHKETRWKSVLLQNHEGFSTFLYTLYLPPYICELRWRCPFGGSDRTAKSVRKRRIIRE